MNLTNLNKMKLIITEKGDSRVGIFDSSYEIECPFNFDEVSESDLKDFAIYQLSIYSEWSHGKLTYQYELPIDQENIP